VKEKLFLEKEEQILGKAVAEAASADLSPGDLVGFFELFTPLIPLITDFFDNVLVMDEDQKIRENRLGMLQEIAGLAEGILDMTRLEGF
jgi:glycyl-tRNA synthetase